jgi:C-terminal processing protease CtpA/Prc
MNESKLSPEKLDNLTSFTKLYGYIKFFHPSSESEDLDWNTFARYGTEKVLEARSREELLATLNDLFQPIAPSILITANDGNNEYPAEKYTPPDTAGYKLIRWVHDGYGTEKDRNKDETIYDSYVVNSDTAEIKEVTIIEKDLGNGLKVKFPSVLYSDGQTFPAADESKLTEFKKALFEKSEGEFKLNSVNFMANIVISWSVFEHFFPYFDVIDEISSGKVSRNDYWDGVLKKALAEASENTSLDEHKIMLRHMVSALNDGHGFVFDSEKKDRSKPPIKIEWIEDSPVVVKSNDDSKDISEGDVILEVDGKDVAELIKSNEEINSASTDGHMKIFSVELDLTRGEAESEVTLKVRKPDGKEVTKTFKRIEGLFPMINFPYYDNFFEPEPDIYYANIMKMKWEELKEKLDTIANAKGVIFDLRGYPNADIYKLLQHLTDTDIKSSRWLVPRITEPGYENVEFNESGIWDLPPLKPRINAKVVFLTNSRALSYAESVMAIVKNYQLGTIIGQRTAGTNGNVNKIFLHGGFEISFTGMKVLNQDSSRFHGVGVVPDIEVNKTIKGVSEKRDEQMEKALEFLKN